MQRGTVTSVAMVFSNFEGGTTNPFFFFFSTFSRFFVVSSLLLLSSRGSWTLLFLVGGIAGVVVEFRYADVDFIFESDQWEDQLVVMPTSLKAIVV